MNHFQFLLFLIKTLISNFSTFSLPIDQSNFTKAALPSAASPCSAGCPSKSSAL